MVAVGVLRRVIFRPNAVAGGLRGTFGDVNFQHPCFCNTAGGKNFEESNDSKWLILPPFNPFADGSQIGKLISRRAFDGREGDSAASPSTTALKWILICCPHLPRSLVQKLFRLRQVRRESSYADVGKNRLKRIVAKELLDIGDRVFLPKSVDEKHPPTVKGNPSLHKEEDLKYIRDLELYKDRAIIVINKPPGMPVQSGLGITRSLDELASKYLRYDYKESPRLFVLLGA